MSIKANFHSQYLFAIQIVHFVNGATLKAPDIGTKTCILANPFSELDQIV